MRGRKSSGGWLLVNELKVEVKMEEKGESYNGNSSAIEQALRVPEGRLECWSTNGFGMKNAKTPAMNRPRNLDTESFKPAS